ncbi:MAG: hypothetical protein REI11_04585 [Patulibacter sp.]|nr:hypothetical protein [Patulibacter sp.]
MFKLTPNQHTNIGVVLSEFFQTRVQGITEWRPNVGGEINDLRFAHKALRVLEAGRFPNGVDLERLRRVAVEQLPGSQFAHSLLPLLDELIAEERAS